MKIYFFGGVQEVTGSNFLLESNEGKILIDCGLIQKQDVCSIENFLPFEYEPSSIDAVFITHGHLDHVGRLPKLLKEGFKGYIYSTLPTKDIAEEILIDSQKIIQENCINFNQENLYQQEDIEKLMSRWQALDYYDIFKIKDFEITFFNAGHILGSAFLKINNFVFSGDLGNEGKSLTYKLDDLPKTDYLVLESTYGNRLHEDLDKRKLILEKILEKTIYQKRILIVPAFAVERTQEIIFDIQSLIKEKKIPPVRIFLDSPLALKISKIYEKYAEYLNPQSAKEILSSGIFDKQYLKIIRDFKDEKEMFSCSPPKIILAGSGMITGGRILNILQEYIELPETTLLFVGYQAKGSLGRKILDGEKKIEINGNDYDVKAEILTLFSYSAHPDQEAILNWIKPQRFKIKKIMLTHGDIESKEALKTRIMDELAIETIIPQYKESFEF